MQLLMPSAPHRARPSDGGRTVAVTYQRAKIVATQGLSQIPESEITLSNGVLKQNPGWK